MKKSLLLKLNNLLYFNKETIRSLSNESENTISKSITRWISNGTLVKLKNGIYTTRESFEDNKDEPGYSEVIASILRSPSYISLEYALDSYEMLTESVYAITSVTMKCNRSYQNKTGTYLYRSISENLFKGYEIRKFKEHEYYFATKSKALFDYIYLRTKIISNTLEDRDIKEEYRLKMDNFKTKDYKELKEYAKMSGKPSTINLINNIL